MSNKLKLLRGSFIYTIGSVLTQLIHIGFVKINTSILSTAEYGKYSLLLTTVSMLNVFVSLGIQSGLTRFYNEYKNPNELKNIVLSFSMVWSLFISSILLLFGRLISHKILGETEHAFLLFVLLLMSVVLFIFIEIYNVNFRMRFMAKKSIILDLSIALINVILLVLFGILLQFGILGVLLAYCLARMLVFLTLFMMDLKNFRFIVEKNKLKRMLHYGIGLMMGNISCWILDFIDRYFLKIYTDFAVVGIYSVGYRIGHMIRPVFTVPFKKIYTPFQLEVYKQKNGKEKIKKMYRYYTLLGWFVVLCFALFSKPLINLIATPEYIESYKIVPWISISYVILTLTMFVGFGLHVANKMFLNSSIITIASIINIGLNIFLIPKFGMYGAAASTILSYIIVNILYFYISRKYWDPELNLIYPYIMGIPFLLFYLVYCYYISNIENIWIQFGLSWVLIIIYIIATVLLKIIDKEEIQQLIRYLIKNNIAKNN